MPVNISAVDCSALDCNGVLGAAGSQVQYCPKGIKRSQLSSVILTNPTVGTLIANWGNALVALDFNIDNADATDVKQKQFFGKGSIAESESSEIELNDFQTYNLGDTNTATFSIYDIDEATHEYWSKVKCGIIKPLGYFTTVDSEIIGVAAGLNFSSIKPNLIFDEGKDAVKRIDVTFTWEAKTFPDVYPYPL